MSRIERLGRKAEDALVEIGVFVAFIGSSLGMTDKRFWAQWRYSVVQQGTHSLWLILISSAFIGMVSALQGFSMLNRFGSEQALGQFISFAMIRELGPVMCSLFFISQGCSTITSELTSMRITMQIDSLEVIGVDPKARLVWPRLCAVVFVAPLLISVFIVSAIMGGSIMSIGILGVDYGDFWSNIISNVDFYNDVCVSLFKGTIFSITAVMIATYQGYCVEPQVEAVAQATTRTIVLGSVLTLALDFILTSFTMTVS